MHRIIKADTKSFKGGLRLTEADKNQWGQTKTNSGGERRAVADND